MPERKQHALIGEQVVAYRNLIVQRTTLTAKLETSVEWVRGILDMTDSKSVKVNKTNMAYGLRRAEIHQIPEMLEELDRLEERLKATDEALRSFGLPLA